MQTVVIANFHHGTMSQNMHQGPIQEFVQGPQRNDETQSLVISFCEQVGRTLQVAVDEALGVQGTHLLGGEEACLHEVVGQVKDNVGEVLFSQDRQEQAYLVNVDWTLYTRSLQITSQARQADLWQADQGQTDWRQSEDNGRESTRQSSTLCRTRSQDVGW